MPFSQTGRLLTTHLLVVSSGLAHMVAHLEQAPEGKRQQDVAACTAWIKWRSVAATEDVRKKPIAIQESASICMYVWVRVRRYFNAASTARNITLT